MLEDFYHFYNSAVSTKNELLALSLFFLESLNFSCQILLSEQ